MIGMVHLIEWAILFFRHKDILTKSITQIDTVGDSLVITKHDGTRQLVECRKELLLSTDIQNEYSKYYLVVDNTQKNVKYLIDNWDTAIKNKKLTIIFVSVKGEGRWMITPATHHIICGSNRQEGIWSLYNQSGE